MLEIVPCGIVIGQQKTLWPLDRGKKRAKNPIVHFVWALINQVREPGEESRKHKRPETLGLFLHLCFFINNSQLHITLSP